jgi:hypothetical protein
MYGDPTLHPVGSVVPQNALPEFLESLLQICGSLREMLVHDLKLTICQV